MKSFPYSLHYFKGIFNYLKRTDKEAVTMTTDGKVLNGELTDFLFKPTESLTMIDSNGNSSPAPHFIINFSKYKVYVINYQMQTIADTTPPVDWSITGSNDNKKWYLLDEKMNQDELICERQTNALNSIRCKKRDTTFYSMTNPIGPFRLLKFTCIRNRVNYTDIRIGGFEIYGSIIPLDGALIAKKTKCVNKKSILGLLLYVMFVTYS